MKRGVSYLIDKLTREVVKVNLKLNSTLVELDKFDMLQYIQNKTKVSLISLQDQLTITKLLKKELKYRNQIECLEETINIISNSKYDK